MSMEEGFDIFENFRLNLKVLRTASSISGKDLSGKLGLSPARINNLEIESAHNPTVLELSLIANWFHVSMDDLIHKKVIIKFE